MSAHTPDHHAMTAHAHATAHGHAGGADPASQMPHVHVSSAAMFTNVLIALLVLTVITVGASRVDFGSNTNLAIAMAIAVVKATLVVLFFMHLFYDKLFHSVLVIGGILAASLFVGFTLMDSSQYQATILWETYATQPATGP